MVRAWGLEPQRIAAREPKSRMSTSSIMPAYPIFCCAGPSGLMKLDFYFTIRHAKSQLRGGQTGAIIMSTE